MKYNYHTELHELMLSLEDTHTGRMSPPEEAVWEEAKDAFIQKYPEDTLPQPDTMDFDPLVMPLDMLQENLRQMCKHAEKTHHFRRHMLENREARKWAIWLDIGCRGAFHQFPEYPKKYREAIRENEGW